MANIANRDSNGLFNNTNTLNRPDGGMWIADNVIVSKQNVSTVRPTFKACANNLPTTIPDQMASFDGSIIVNTDFGLWYEGANCNFFKLFLENGIFFESRNITDFPSGNSASPNIYMVEGVKTYQLYHNISKLSFLPLPAIPFSSYYYNNVTGIKYPTISPPAASDGLPAICSLRAPSQICYGKDGQYMYFADYLSATVRQLRLSDLSVSVISGKLDTPGNADGALGTSRNYGPNVLYYDPTTREVFYADLQLYVFNFKKVNADTNVTTTISTDFIPSKPVETTELRARSMFSTPTSNYCYINFVTTLTTSGTTFPTTGGASIVRINKTTGAAIDFCGNWYFRGSVVGTAANTRFENPGQIAGDKDNNYLYVPNENYIIRVSVADGSTTRWLGSGTFGKKDGIGSNCDLDGPQSCVVYDDGNMIIIGYETVRIVNLSTASCRILSNFSSKNPRIDGFLDTPITGPQI